MKPVKSNQSHDFEIKSALRKRGYVTGDGGIDKIPAKLTRGEAVLPRETVEALGGPEGVDELILRTTGKRSAPQMKDGELHAVRGYSGYLDDAAHRAGEFMNANNMRDLGEKTGAFFRSAAERARAAKDAFNSGAAGETAGPDPKARFGAADTSNAYRQRAADTSQWKGGMTQEQWARNRPTPEQVLRGAGEAKPGMVQTAKDVVGKGVEAVKDMTGKAVEAVKPKPTPWYKPSGIGFKGVGLAARGAVPLAAATGMVGGVNETANTDIDRYGESLGVDMKDAGTFKRGALTGLRFLQGTGNSIASMFGFGDLDRHRAQYDTRVPAEQKPFNPLSSAAAAPAAQTGPADPAGTGDRLSNSAPPAPPTAAAPAPGMSEEERRALDAATARQNHEDRMNAYARESALRRQMVEDQAERDYNPGTGLAEVMPETDMFGKTAAQRSADMYRSDASLALSRVGHGAGRRYAERQLGLAKGFNDLAESVLNDEQRNIGTRKEMVSGHLTRQAALRGKGVDAAVDRQKSTDVREGARYRDDQARAANEYVADQALKGDFLKAQGDFARASATKYGAKLRADQDAMRLGGETYTAAAIRRFGDPQKDDGAKAKINDNARLVYGALRANGLPASVLADPRVAEAAMIAAERSGEVRDSERGIFAAIKGFLDPTKRPMTDVDDFTAYQIQSLGRQTPLDRRVETRAGSSGLNIHRYGKSSYGDMILGDRLPRGEIDEQVAELDGRRKPKPPPGKTAEELAAEEQARRKLRAQKDSFYQSLQSYGEEE